MEVRGVKVEQLRAGIDEALALIEAIKVGTLLDALRKLSAGTPNPLRAYMLGDELVITVGSYSLLSVNVREGRVRTWEDWRDRLAAAARDAASSVVKRLMAASLDRGEDLPASLREGISRLATAVEKAGVEELELVLRKLRGELQGIVSV